MPSLCDNWILAIEFIDLGWDFNQTDGQTLNNWRLKRDGLFRRLENLNSFHMAVKLIDLGRRWGEYAVNHDYTDLLDEQTNLINCFLKSLETIVEEIETMQ